MGAARTAEQKQNVPRGGVAGALPPAHRTSGRWLGPPDRPLLGWLTAPLEATTGTGVLVLPPVGYPYWSSHRTLRVIAERLASDGHVALRLDYDGTGDSAGDQWDPDRLPAWRASLRAGAEELRALGCTRLVLVGARLGATLALFDGATVGAAAVVAWEPVASGRRYAKEIRLMSIAVPADADAQDGGALVSAGTVFGAETLAELSRVAVTAIEAPPAPRVVLVGGAPDAKTTDHLRHLGAEVDPVIVSGGDQALGVPSEEAEVPGEVVGAISRGVGPAPRTTPFRPPERAAARLTWNGAPLTEEVVALGPERLVGILTEPVAPDRSSATVVFLNTGSEPHIGPGRAWVEYARELAARGHRSLRIDFRGWGESPDDGHAPGRPYAAHAEDDAAAIIRALRERGHERVVLVGLCASAWVALRVVLHEPAAGVIALNPQLYWQPGDPVEALMTETRVRRTAERRREERGGRCGLWTALDVLGQRPWAGEWLDDLRAAGVPVLMLFAAGDDGLEYLGNRLKRRLTRTLRSGVVTVAEVPDIDHSMHRAWLRGAIVDALHEQVLRLEG